MFVRDIIKKYNPFEERGKDSKIVVYEDSENKGVIKIAYITPEDIKFNFISKVNAKINDTGLTLFYGSGKIFALIHIEKDIYSLKPLKPDQDLDTIFHKIKEEPLSSGSYGKVVDLPQNIVVKISKQKELERDIIMEIGIYSMLKQLHCLPIMYGFNLGKESKIYLEKGKDTLYKLIPYLSDIQRLDIIFRLCKCMRSIVGQGIMHLDLKPQNIIIGKNEKVYIIDWGTAEIDTRRKNFRPKETDKQTLWYRAPEILAKDSKYSIGVDIYSLGLIFLEMFTGEPPLTGDKAEYTIRVLRLSGFTEFLFRYEDDDTIALENNKVIEKLQQRYTQVYNSVNYSTKDKTILRLKEKFNIHDEALQDFLAGMLEFKPEFRSRWNDIIIHPIFQRMKRESIPRFNMLINNMPIIENINKIWNSQKNINSKMRRILFKWLDDVKRNPNYPIESLELAFQLTDLWICNNTNIYREKLQLIGSIMFILGVSIYRDIFVDDLIDSFVYLSAESFSRLEFVILLNNVITFFNGNIIIPTYTSYSYFLEKEPINSFDNYMRSDIYSESFLTQITGEKVKLDIWKK